VGVELSLIGPPPKRMAGPAGGDDYNAALEMRTVASPSSTVQWVLSGGPYTVSSQTRHVQVVPAAVAGNVRWDVLDDCAKSADLGFI
jgi:hypothetical protein